MNAIPELQPIAIAILSRPKFDNTRLGIAQLWQDDNAEALARYYRQQMLALPPDERASSSDDEFDVWLRIQHDIEVQNMARAKKVAEAIANLDNPNIPRTIYQPPNLSEHDVEVQHQQAQAKRLK